MFTKIIKYIGRPFLCIESSKFAQLPLSFNGPINKVIMMAEVEVKNGLNNMDFYSPRMTWL